MSHPKRWIGLVTSLLLITLVGGLAHAQDAPAFGTVSGTVSYLPRIALPEGAEVVVELSDVSRADAPSKVIASQLIIANGRQVPIQYSLTYDTASIREGGTYTVSARIYVDDVLAWITDTAYPLGSSGEFTADIDVVQVAPPVEATEAPETAAFGTVTGTITYPQRIALPDNAEIEVELLHIMEPDRPYSEVFVLASQRFITGGRQVPFSFVLNYDAHSIVEEGEYIVNARVMIDYEWAWVSNQHPQVITNDVFLADVVLEPVGVS